MALLRHHRHRPRGTASGSHDEKITFPDGRRHRLADDIGGKPHMHQSHRQSLDHQHGASRPGQENTLGGKYLFLHGFKLVLLQVFKASRQLGRDAA